ncbi:MAG: PQQ-binding-like beta-propeller repeat protein [Ferruginibacter sp.]
MRKIFGLLTVLLFAGTTFSQNITPWIKKFSGNVKWYTVSDLGVLVVCTGDALYGLSPEKGEEVWKIDKLDDVKEENYDPIEGTPYASIVKSKLLGGKQHTLIDLSNGKMLVNTKELGFADVTKRLEAMSNGTIMFYGLNKSGKPMLANYSLIDGKEVWSQNKLFEKNSEEIVSRAFVTADGIYLATTKNLYKLNPANGEILWSVDKKTEKPIIATVEKKKNFFTGGGGQRVDINASATSASSDFFQRDDKKVVYFWNQEELVAYNTADGKEVFKPIELQSSVGYMLYDTHGMLVTTTEKTQSDVAKQGGGGGGLMGKIARNKAGKKNRASILCIDPITGASKWGDEIDLQGDVLAYKLTGSKLILATERDKGDNYISIIDLEAGKSVTKKPLPVNGEIKDLHIVPQGLYYRTSDEINILDLATGDKTWKKGFKVKSCVGGNTNDKEGYVYAKGTIYKVNFEQGELTEWVKGIDLQGGEEPTSLQVRDNGVALISEQNMNLYGFDGSLTWHSYQTPIGRTGFGKALSGLGGLASLAVGAAGAAQSAQLSYAKGYYGSTDPQLDRDIKNSNNLAAAGIGGAISSFKSISKRFKASKQADDYVSVMTKLGGNNQANSAGIVIVEKASGKTTAQMMIGDKTPDYKIDEIGRIIFQKSDNNEISGFKF